MLARCSFFCVWVDAHIDPLGTIEFALDFRKNGFYRRDDALNRPLRTSREITGGVPFCFWRKNFFDSCNQCTELSSFEAEGQMKKEESL